MNKKFWIIRELHLDAGLSPIQAIVLEDINSIHSWANKDRSSSLYRSDGFLPLKNQAQANKLRISLSTYKRAKQVLEEMDFLEVHPTLGYVKVTAKYNQYFASNEAVQNEPLGMQSGSKRTTEAVQNEPTYIIKEINKENLIKEIEEEPILNFLLKEFTKNKIRISYLQPVGLPNTGWASRELQKHLEAYENDFKAAGNKSPRWTMQAWVQIFCELRNLLNNVSYGGWPTPRKNKTAEEVSWVKNIKPENFLKDHLCDEGRMKQLCHAYEILAR